jgi:hypothetical protein
VHLRPAGATFTVARDVDGLAALTERLAGLAPGLIVLEAAGHPGNRLHELMPWQWARWCEPAAIAA